jgi:hypothetical protein
MVDGNLNLLVDRMSRSAPRSRLLILVDEKPSAAGSAAANSGAGRRGNSAGVHLADLRSDV